MLPVAVAWSSSDDRAVSYVLPVLSCLPIVWIRDRIMKPDSPEGGTESIPLLIGLRRMLVVVHQVAALGRRSSEVDP